MVFNCFNDLKRRTFIHRSRFHLLLKCHGIILLHIMVHLSLRHKIFRNPALGLLPLLVFSFLLGRVEGIEIPLVIAFALSVFGYFIVNKHSRLIYKVSIISFTISLVWSQISNNDLLYYDKYLVVVIFFLLSLIGCRLSRKRMMLQSAKNCNHVTLNYLAESFRVAFHTQYALSIHLLIVFLLYIYRLPDSDILSILSGLVVSQIIIITIIVLEEIRLRMLDKKLQSEEWLPIINEEGVVTGKVAKSVVKASKNQYMHPVVRVAFLFDGKIYLQERKKTDQLDPLKLDYPLEKFVLFNQEIVTVVNEGVQKLMDNVDVPLRFILKYVFKNELINRLVFLYVVDIPSEEVFKTMHFKQGKLWTTTQIDDNLGGGTFSECFEIEYEYLKNTVLLVPQS